MAFFIFALAILPAAFALSGSPSEYHDILNDGKAEWRLAFRGTAHIGESVYEAYLDNYDTDVDEGCKGINFAAECKTHYRNDDALDNWWMVNEVLFGIVKDGALVKTITFNGTGTDYVNWFDNDRYLDSCYKDFETQPKNYFSMRGQGGARRRFFINRNYDGCPNNAGWFVATDSEKRTCDWERGTGRFPILKYAAGPTYSNWNEETASLADAFVIFIKYHPYSGQSSEYFDVFNTGIRDHRLAFRATAGAGYPSYEAYMKGTGIPADIEAGCMTTDWSAECKNHYRNNDALNNYKWQEIEHVLFGIVDDGAIVKTITFKAHGTNYFSWYHTAHVIESCWTDFKDPKNYFGIAGHHGPPRIGRSFFINRSYGGCGNDHGWVVAVDNFAKDNPYCDWEKTDSIPSLLYAAGLQRSKWTNRANIHNADAFVVFIKYKFEN